MIKETDTCPVCGALMLGEHEFVVQSIVENIDSEKDLQYGPLYNIKDNSICDYIYVAKYDIPQDELPYELRNEKTL